jgi:hypothetical protein
MNAPPFTLGEDCWPRERPPTLNAPQGEVEVIPVERLAITGVK